MDGANAKNSLLYDYYGALLSERQREVFELYHEDNLSLSEIAGLASVSRQAVHTALGKAEERLASYEDALGLIAKHEEYERALKEILAKTDGILRDKVRAGKIEKADEAVLKDLRRIKKVIKGLDI
ncbi:MAG: hypothetical protein LBN12_00405 [Clostridiales Family XIII bacterium]|jgi:predicted DNA-binding protein YlxM (UPF0122 family)|nr:hypothetical protein [Clostridiales Family XIII bacterium]